jgi:hypothetical protein
MLQPWNWRLLAHGLHLIKVGVSMKRTYAFLLSLLACGALVACSAATFSENSIPEEISPSTLPKDTTGPMVAQPVISYETGKTVFKFAEAIDPSTVIKDISYRLVYYFPEDFSERTCNVARLTTNLPGPGSGGVLLDGDGRDPGCNWTMDPLCCLVDTDGTNRCAGKVTSSQFNAKSKFACVLLLATDAYGNENSVDDSEAQQVCLKGDGLCTAL